MPSLIYSVFRDGSKNYNIRTCEHMIFGQLWIAARQTNYAPLLVTRVFLRLMLWFQMISPCSMLTAGVFPWTSDNPLQSVLSSQMISFTLCWCWSIWPSKGFLGRICNEYPLHGDHPDSHKQFFPIMKEVRLAWCGFEYYLWIYIILDAVLKAPTSNLNSANRRHPQSS